MSTLTNEMERLEIARSAVTENAKKYQELREMNALRREALRQERVESLRKERDKRKAKRARRNANIAKDVLTGESAGSIAKRYKLSIESIRRIAENQGLDYIAIRRSYTPSNDEKILKRNVQIVEGILSGQTASEAGRQYQLSRERIGQIMAKYGWDYKEIFQQRLRLRREFQAQERADSGKSNREDRRTSIEGYKGPLSSKKFSDEEMFEHLRIVANALGTDYLTSKMYTENRDPKSQPSPALYYVRFVSWNYAVESAGLIPSKALRTYNYKWSDEQIISTIVEFLNDPNQFYFGASQYERWTKGKEVPSCATILKRRAGWNWSAWKEAALLSMNIEPIYTESE